MCDVEHSSLHGAGSMYAYVHTFKNVHVCWSSQYFCDFPVYFEEAVFSRKSDGWLVVNMIL